MKKKSCPRILFLLLALTVMSSTGVSVTMARYTATATVADTSRVTKWGVTLDANGSLFGFQYDALTSAPVVESAKGIKVNAGEMVKIDENGNEVVDKDGNLVMYTEKVVAPGTENKQGFSFGINGAPETSVLFEGDITHENVFLKQGTYAVMREARGLNKDNFKYWQLGLYKYDDVDKKYSRLSTTAGSVTYDSDAIYYQKAHEITRYAVDYYPVVYDVVDGQGKVLFEGKPSSDSAKGAADYIKNKIGTTNVSGGTIINKEYPAKKDLAAVIGLSDVTITWKWLYEVSGTAGDIVNRDALDTILGNISDGKTIPGDPNGCVVKIVNGLPELLVKGDKDASDYDPTKDDYNITTGLEFDISVSQVD